MSRTISRQDLATDKAVASTATVYSDPVNIGRGVNFSYEMIVAGTGPDIKLFHQITSSQTNDVDKINTPASLGTFRTPSTNGTIKDNINATESDSLSLVASKWVRFGFTGVGSNGADVTVTFRLQIQSDTEAL